MLPNVPPNELPLENQVLADRSIAIRLIGVGGAGANAVDRLKLENLDRLQLAVLDTDLQAISSSVVQEKLLLGPHVRHGLSAGGDPELGREAAEASVEPIDALVKDCDLVFLLAGLGGGTGSGAAPLVAEQASAAGALVIAFVALPFSFEGGRRTKQAEEALLALRRSCDAVIPLPNDVLLQEGSDDPGVLASFARADAWIGAAVKSIWAMLFRTGLINLDFATLRQAFAHRGGKTLFGLASGEGDEAVAGVIQSLKDCPLLHLPEHARRADRLLVNITGGTDLTLPKVNELMTAIAEQFGKESHVIMGAVIDEGMQGRIEVCVLGTSDLTGRGAAMRRPLPAARLTARPAGSGASYDGAGAIPANGVFPAVPHGGRSGATAASGASHSSAATSPAGTPASQPPSGGPGSATVPAAPVPQEEFGFVEVESRGYFERTDRNLFEGEDLDKPTYFRRGVKIVT